MCIRDRVLLQVSRRKEEWSHTFTDLKPSSLYRVTLEVSKPDPESSPLLVFVTVDGDTVAHLQVSIVVLVNYN